MMGGLWSASGLIIDAFGELRDQQEQVKEDMEVRQNIPCDHNRTGKLQTHPPTHLFLLCSD